MYHFFTDASLINGHDIYIEGPDYNHIKNVLRLHPGDTISVSDGTGRDEYRCHIEAFETDRVHLKLAFVKTADVELPVRLTLFQGLPKSDKMDLIVQKSVELGITEIVPVELARCVTRLDRKKKQARVRRWNTIAESAAKQSKRAVIPTVQDVMTLEEALSYSGTVEHKLIPYELNTDPSSAADIIEHIKAGESACMFIGPEGGFEEAEVEAARAAGFTDISLGRRILRTETAALVLLSWFIYLFEIRK